LTKTVQEWITAVGARPTIEPGSPWENGYIDSFNAPCEMQIHLSACCEAVEVLVTWQPSGEPL
jgi:hypothetical protein